MLSYCIGGALEGSVRGRSCLAYPPANINPGPGPDERDLSGLAPANINPGPVRAGTAPDSGSNRSESQGAAVAGAILDHLAVLP